jgi:glycosyltransferase involved in cell wall biosynthesis
MHRISIAMATYNGSQFLSEQLESILNQRLRPDELIACDDGSSDDTVEILQRFADRAPFPVRIARNESNLGFVANFSKAASLCSGDIIFFCDQDDLWDVDKLERVVTEFEADPAAMVILNDARLIDENGRDSGHTQYGNIRSAGAPDNYFNTGCCSAHRKAWQSVALPVPSWMDYHDVWINLFSHVTGTARILPVALQQYRRHGNSVTNWELSRLNGASSLLLLKSHGLRDAREGWRWQVRLLEEMAARLEKAEPGKPLPSNLIDEARARVAAHRKALANRIELCSLPRWRRPRRLLKSWARGEYAFFQSWKSAAKDLVRP